jgi:hypothetical protein
VFILNEYDYSLLLEVGDKMIAKNSSEQDHTTQGKIYKIVDINGIGFWIINDKGQEIITTDTTLRCVGN